MEEARGIQTPINFSVGAIDQEFRHPLTSRSEQLTRTSALARGIQGEPEHEDASWVGFGPTLGSSAH
jgi:hypothetical protein